MTDSDIRAVFAEAYNGKTNFLTPYIIGYGKRGRLVWELSKGKGLFPGTQLYGVTVIELPRTKRPDLSNAFSSEEEARGYIRQDFGALTT